MRQVPFTPPPAGIRSDPKLYRDWIERGITELAVASQAFTVAKQISGPFNHVKVDKCFSVQGVMTPAQITGDQNNYNPTDATNSAIVLENSCVLRLDTDASRSITGLTAPTAGTLTFLLVNVGSNDIVLVDESASSTAANRFALDENATLKADEGLWLWYDATSSRWRSTRDGLSGVLEDLNTLGPPSADGEFLVATGAGAFAWESGSTVAQSIGGITQDLDTMGVASTDGEMIVATGAGASAWESGATLRTSIGVGTGDTPQFAGFEVGHASDTTVTRGAAGILHVEGNEVPSPGSVVAGDTLYADAVNSWTRLAKGSDGDVLTLASGIPSWAAGSSGGDAAFLVFQSADDSNETGAGASHTIIFDSEVFDTGADFSSTTFTAPTTGRYLLSAAVTFRGTHADMNNNYVEIDTSNRNYRARYEDTSSDSADDVTVTITVIADMDAADTATVDIVFDGHSGDTIDIAGDATILETYFSGYHLE